MNKAVDNLLVVCIITVILDFMFFGLLGVDYVKDSLLLIIPFVLIIVFNYCFIPFMSKIIKEYLEVRE